MAKKYCYLVFTSPTPGKEKEYNDWYTNQHLSDVLKVPGFVAATRYQLNDLGANGAKMPHRYLAIYEVETDDPAATLADLNSRAGTPDMVMTDALDVASVSTSLFGAICDRQVARREHAKAA